MATSGAFLEEVYKNAVDAEVLKRSTTLSNMADNAKEYNKKIAAYEDLKARLSTLSQTSKDLYSFNSPFKKFIGNGEGIPDYFTVTANRVASTTTHSIDIKQVAQSQKFSSRAYNMNDKLPAGTVTFKIGDSEKTINFQGGTLLNFQQAIDKAFGKSIKTTITQKSKNMQVLTIDLVETGAKNIIEVINDDSGITKELNMFTRRPYRYLGHIFNENLLKQWKDESDNITTNYIVKNDFLVLEGVNKLSLPLDKEALANTNITVSLTARVDDKNNPTEEMPPLLPPTVTLSIPDTGVLFDKIDSVKFKDVELYGEGLSPADNARTFEDAKKYNEALEAERKSKEGLEPKAPEPVDETGFDSEIIGVRYITAKGEEAEKYFSLPTISTSWQRLNIPIGNQFSEGDIITDIILINKNANYNVYYKDILVEDTEKEEDAPNFPITDAKDARASIDGVDVLSDSNEFKNVVSGLNITAIKPTPKAFDTTIEADKESVVNAMVNFIRAYNETIDFLNDTTLKPLSRDVMESLPDMNRTDMFDLATTLGIEYNPDMTDAAIRKKLSNVGVFNGNSVVNTISQRIRSIIVAPYVTDYGEELALLDQIGINRGKVGEDWKKVSKGFLQVDEESFMSKIETQMDGIEELFANDTTGDNLPDTGIAFTLNDFITPYAQTRGIVDNTIAMTKTQLNDNKKRMDTERERVDQYRESRTAAYYKMQSELKNAEREQKRLESLQRSQQGN